MERTKSKLSSRLTNSLSCNNTDSFTHLYHTSRGKVTTITLLTYTFLAFTSENRTNLYHLNWRVLYSLGLSLCDLLTSSNNNITSCRINHIVNRDTSQDTLIKSCYGFITILQSTTLKSTKRTTILLCDDHIM